MTPKIRRWLLVVGLAALIGGPLLGAAAYSTPCHPKMPSAGAMGVDAAAAAAGRAPARPRLFDAPTVL
jgi:hypothetical protein